MLKNTAGQKWEVFAINESTSNPVDGDEANITAEIKIGAAGSLTALADVNPTPVPGKAGYYLFDLSQAETNANQIWLYPISSTSSVRVIPAPGTYSPVAESTGNGDRIVRISVVDDNGNAVPNAPVTILDSAGNSISVHRAADSLGVAEFHLNDGDYRGIVGAMGGYSAHTAEAFTVDEDGEAVTLTVTATSIDATAADQSVLVVDCLDEAGNAEEGVEIQMQVIAVPASSLGFSFDSTIQRKLSDGTGVARLTGVRGGRYRVRRGDTGGWKEITLADAVTTVAASFIGLP